MSSWFILKPVTFSHLYIISYPFKTFLQGMFRTFWHYLYSLKQFSTFLYLVKNCYLPVVFIVEFTTFIR